MRTIWKYELRGHTSTLTLPVGARVLHFAIQAGDMPHLWVEFDPSVKEREERTFEAMGTGEPFDERAVRYIGTAMNNDKTRVWHLYEVQT